MFVIRIVLLVAFLVFSYFFIGYAIKYPKKTMTELCIDTVNGKVFTIK
jgi:hypothetical protein